MTALAKELDEPVISFAKSLSAAPARERGEWLRRRFAAAGKPLTYEESEEYFCRLMTEPALCVL